MKKQIMLDMISFRIDTLKGYMKCYNINKNVNGDKLTLGSANYKRTHTKRDLQLCYLLEELVTQTKGNDVFISDDSVKGFLRLVEPNERHLKNNKIL